MFIQPHQLPEILSAKKGCQRGLEEYIVQQHWGDKKIYQPSNNIHSSQTNNSPQIPHSYGYLNNPVYRVGKEGDPAPEGLSSRHIYQLGDYQPGFTETESTLHLLYPTIDSGTQFSYEKPWDMDWYYSRSNIPNQLASPEEVAISKEKTNTYDDFVERRRASETISKWMNRPLPVYDQQRIDDELLPDSVRQVDLGSSLDEKGIPIIGNTVGKHQVTKDGVYVGGIENYVPNVENYAHVSSNSNRTKPSAGLGAYGYPQPHGYAEVGASRHRYDVYPGYIPGINVEYFGNAASSNSNWLWIIAITFIVIMFLVLRKK